MVEDGRAGIDASLVQRLVASQFPAWGHLTVRPVADDGWDNRTYRLGDELSVRLPTAPGYVAAVAKEDVWLPRLAPQLPLPVPQPVATGRPALGYPFPWSVRRWLPGQPLRHDLVDDPATLATALAGFLRTLWGIDGTGGPAAGEHSFFRGASLLHYDDEVRASLLALRGLVDVRLAESAWEEALQARWPGPPAWFHGDVAAGNLLVRDGRLSAVIDFGTSGVGDPACDLVIAWTFFRGAGRSRFRHEVDRDDATWARARGWGLWKSMLTLTEQLRAGRPDPVEVRLVEDLLTSG